MMSLQSRRLPRLLLILGCAFLYLVLFVALYPVVGASIALLAIVPTVVAAWYSGLWGGLLAALLVPVVNTLLLTEAGEPGGWSLLLVSGLAPRMAIALSGVLATSWVRAQYLRAIQAEAALRESEARKTAILEAAVDAVLALDHTGAVREFNAAAVRLFGYSRAEILGRPLDELVRSTDYAVNYRDSFARYLETGESHIFGKRLELTAQRQDGRQIPVEVTVTPAEGVSPSLFTGYIRDLTAWQKAQQQLHESEERYRCLVEQAADAIFVMDATGRFLDVNRRACDSLGYSREELLAMSAVDIGVAVRAGPFRPGETTTLETRHRRKDGSTFPVEVRLGTLEAGGRQLRLALIRDITARRQAELALQRSESLLRLVWENSADGMRLTDRDGTVVMANQAYCRLVGRSLPQVIGHPFTEAYTPQLRAPIMERYRTRFETRTIREQFEAEAELVNGQRRWFEVSSAFLEVPGEATLLLGVIRDITRRKGIEASLRDSEARYRELFETNPHPMWVYDIETLHILTVNDAAVQQYGYTRDEFLGLTALDLRPAEDVSRFRQELTQFPESQPPRLWRHRCKDGSVREVEVASHALQYLDRPARLVLAMDVTERRKAEEALRESEERFRTMADSAPVMIWMSGLDKKCTYFNQPWLAFTGRPYEPEGEGWTADVHPEDLPRSLETYVQSFDNRLPFEMEYRLRRHDGEYRWVLDRGTPRFTPSGQFAGYIGTCLDITDRRHAAESVRISEQRLTRAQQIARLGSWERDLLRNQLWWSDQVYVLFGVDRRSFTPTYEGFLALVHPEDRSRVQEASKRVLPNGKIYRIDHRIVLPSGEERVVSEQAEIVRDASGQPIRMVGTVLDITDRVRAEEALRKSEERFRRVFEDSPLGIYRAAPSGQILLANPAAIRMAGCESFDELAHHNLKNDGLHAGYDLSEFEVRLETEGEVRGLETTWRRKDGSVALVRENVRTIRDQEGRILYYEGTLEDITDRRRAEEALRQREELLRTIIAHIPCAVFWKDRQSVYLGCNDLTARYSGFRTAEDLIGRSDREFVLDSTQAEFYIACDRQVMETGEPMLNIEESLTRADGTSLTLQTSKVPLRDAAGAVVGVLGIYRDVTEHKKLEEQYRQSQKMEAIGRLAGGVAHDFNNLLTVINGYCQLLQFSLPEGDPARRSIEEINKAGERAASLTGQLLAFSRKTILRPRVLDLNALLSDMSRMLGRLLGEDIDLQTRLASHLRRIKADPGQIEQVVLNLAVNARDAMPTGGRLTLETANVWLEEAYTRTQSDVRPGPYVLLTVSDTGCGMAPKTLARIFEPFFTTKGPGKGTGLGLAMVYGVVRQTEGHIAVSSEPGAGTTFKVYLPCAEEEPNLEGGRSSGMARGGRETILLVEDEESVRGLARQILHTRGYDVLEAADGQEALELAAQHSGPIHLLVSDVVMPRISGREVASRLTELRPELRVLFMSGYTDDAVVRHGVFESGMPFLQKPFGPDQLAAKVREVLDREQ